MKQLIILIIAGMALGYSCQKENPVTYHSEDNVYFDFDPETNDRDSIVYTFAYTPGILKDTLFLPVRISGNRIPESRTFGISIVAEGTTAMETTHFEPFKDSYTIPADSGTFLLPLILYNTDTELSNKSVILNFKLLPGNGLDTTINSLIYGKVVFSNKLEKPVWWNMWLGGYYSQVKHELFLISSGTTDLTLSGLDAPKNLYHVGRLNNFLNNPFDWIIANPGTDYMLELRPDGNYDFYNSNNPSKKILYRENTQSGKFYFIDENGIEVI